jgi:hypothetical protein
MFELKFDEAPTLIYIQKANRGIGELYMNGKRLTGLQEIEIKAQSNDEKIYFPELKLKIMPEKLAEFGTQEE